MEVCSFNRYCQHACACIEVLRNDCTFERTINAMGTQVESCFYTEIDRNIENIFVENKS